MLQQRCIKYLKKKYLTAHNNVKVKVLLYTKKYCVELTRVNWAINIFILKKLILLHLLSLVEPVDNLVQ